MIPKTLNIEEVGVDSVLIFEGTNMRTDKKKKEYHTR